MVSNERGQPRGLALFILRNFEYRSVASVDSELHQKSNQNHNSHEFKVGDFELKNLLEDQKFKTILKPEDPISQSNSATYSAFRVFCKVKPPVGGIPVKEHIELNMKPLTLQVTNKVREHLSKLPVYSYRLLLPVYFILYPVDLMFTYYQFYRAIRNFFFPDPDEHGRFPSVSATEAETKSDPGSASKSLLSRFRNSNPSLLSATQSVAQSVAQSSAQSSAGWEGDYERFDESKIMANRAKENHTFLYIKVPQVPLNISYEHQTGKAVKSGIRFSIPDINNFRLDIPCIEYKNKVWTWKDLAVNIKTDCRRALIHQAIKERLFKVKGRKSKINFIEEEFTDETDDSKNDKSKLLFPPKTKKGFFSRIKKGSG